MAILLAESFPHLLFRRSQTYPDKTAFLEKREGAWAAVNWRQFSLSVQQRMGFLKELGIRKSDVVLILSSAHPGLVYFDLALQSLGAIPAPLFSSVSTEDLANIIADVKPKFVLYDSQRQKEKLSLVGGQVLSGVRTAMMSLGVTDGFHEFPGDLPVTAESIATLIFTSGTSNRMKAVALSQKQLMSSVVSLTSALELSERDVSPMYLPQAHIMGRLEFLSSFVCGLTPAFLSDPSGLMEELLDLRPTVVLGVPRVFEKIRNSLHATLRSGGLGLVFGRRIDTLVRAAAQKSLGSSIGLRESVDAKIFESVVHPKVSARFGGRLRFMVSGGAPLPVDLAEFFFGIGIPLLEGYGLTETAGPVAVNRPRNFRLGRVGRSLDCVRLKLSQDGEVLASGDSVFSGYWIDGKLSPSLDGDGFFWTGDLGRFDEHGFLEIVGRKKELIVLSNGRNVFPGKIEEHVLRNPTFQQVIVFGDNKPFLIAIAVVAPSGLPDELKSLAMESVEVKRYLQSQFDSVNHDLAPHEQIRAFHVLKRELTAEAGELTVSQKLRRDFIANRYGLEIDNLYKVHES